MVSDFLCDEWFLHFVRSLISLQKVDSIGMVEQSQNFTVLLILEALTGFGLHPQMLGNVW